MDMEGALRARLIAAGPVTALVGQRIYWVDRPQEAALPAITLQIIDDPREQHMKGLHEFQQTLVQIDVWSATYAAAKALKEAIIAALLPAATSNGVVFGRSFVRSRDLSERTETQFIHRPSMDFTINHASA
jgi:hypothetical protein